MEKHIDDHFVSLKDINKLRAAMVKKEADECKTQYKNCSKTVFPNNVNCFCELKIGKGIFELDKSFGESDSIFG